MGLQDSYNNFNSSSNSLISLIEGIISNGEFTEEDKNNLNTLKIGYNSSYIDIKEELQNASNIELEKKIIEIASKNSNLSQLDVFNALTNNGQAQGIFIDEETEEVYINAEFLQTRGLRVVNDNNEQTLYIDENGNLTTSGDIVGGTITGAKLQALTIDTNEVNIQSQDGGMVLKGALQKFTDENGNVRILIGKDADNTFKFLLLGENGSTVLIDEDGIKSDAIATGTIIGAHIKGETIEGIHIKGETITGNHIQGDSITGTHIKGETIEGTHIKSNTITGTHIQGYTIGAEHIQAGSITANNIASGTITSNEIASNSIVASNLKTGTITAESGVIANGAITTAMIGTGVIGESQIADASITDAKIVELTASKLTTGTLDAANIDVINLNCANLTVGTINGQQIASGSIDGGHIKTGIIKGEHIGVGTIKSDNIANGSITEDKIPLGEIAASKLNISSHMLF
ncbi:hypothetical protein [Terrisporobacter vanillatitrophus]|uniref:hypothetical protein n=1 Tax=Terrisporobacter vanillatitrophus TaxID=3058402 RepID=UPI003368B4F8